MCPLHPMPFCSISLSLSISPYRYIDMYICFILWVYFVSPLLLVFMLLFFLFGSLVRREKEIENEWKTEVVGVHWIGVSSHTNMFNINQRWICEYGICTFIRTYHSLSLLSHCLGKCMSVGVWAPTSERSHFSYIFGIENVKSLNHNMVTLTLSVYCVHNKTYPHKYLADENPVHISIVRYAICYCCYCCCRC